LSHTAVAETRASAVIVEQHQRNGVVIQRSVAVARRGNRMQLTLARIELAMEGLIAVDRLLVLNQALTNVLQDDAGGR
jgi:hypothetical protein